MINETRNFKLWDFEEKKAIELSFKKAGDHRWKALCCFHTEKHASLYYYDLTESYYCFGCGRHGISYEKYLRYIEALKPFNLVESLGEPVASYAYRDEEGKLLYQKYRFEKRNEKGEIEKTFRIWRPDSKGGIIRNIQGIRRVIYNLDKINNSGDKIIFLLEGEKDCDNLMTRFEGILATTSDIGAGRGFKKWRPEYYDFFQDRSIIIIPDNDKVSRTFYRDIGNSLVGIAKSAKWLILPGLKEHGDITDWLTQGGTLEELFKLIEKAPEFPLPIPIEERECITLYELRRSKLPPKKMLLSNGIIPIKGFGLIGGLTKEGKTTFGLQMALCLVSGNHFLEDFKVIKKCKVLYLYHEDDIYLINDKTDLLMNGFAETEKAIREEDEKNLHIINAQNYTFDSKNPELGSLRKIISEVKPDVIFLDPLQLFTDSDLTKSDNIKKLRDFLKHTYDCFWMIIHHYIKPSYLSKGTKEVPPIYKLLGSSYLANMCDTFIGLEREGENYSEENKIIHFTLRWERTPIPMHLYRNPETLLYEPVDSVSLLRGKITARDVIQVLEESFKGVASYKDLSRLCQDHFGVTDSAVAHKLKEAKEAGMVFKEVGKRGLWSIKDPEKLI